MKRDDTMAETTVNNTYESTGTPVYSHTQRGTAIIVLLLLTMGGMTVMVYFTADTVAVMILVPLLAILAISLLLFHSLTVSIDGENVNISFGVRAIKKKFRLQDIEACTCVTNPVIFGLGIHKIPGGWIYNVSGLEAVELNMRGEGIVRIGTDEPQKLCEAIEKARNEAYG